MCFCVVIFAFVYDCFVVCCLLLFVFVSVYNYVLFVVICCLLLFVCLPQDPDEGSIYYHAVYYTLNEDKPELVACRFVIASIFLEQPLSL